MSDPMDDAINAARKMAMVEGTLLKNRVVTLFGEIDQDSARRTNEKLLALSFESKDPITLIISSPGGHVESGDSIYDMIQFVDAPVNVVGTGWVGSAGALIYLAADKERRYSLPNTRYLIHQPAGGFGGAASDIEIHAREILKMRERLNRTIADRTGQSVEKIAEETLPGGVRMALAGTAEEFEETLGSIIFAFFLLLDILRPFSSSTSSSCAFCFAASHAAPNPGALIRYSPGHRRI